MRFTTKYVFNWPRRYFNVSLGCVNATSRKTNYNCLYRHILCHILISNSKFVKNSA